MLFEHILFERVHYLNDFTPLLFSMYIACACNLDCELLWTGTRASVYVRR